MGECVVCLDNVPQVTFIDCGHACTCASCALQWLTDNVTCPVCRKVVTQVESQDEINQLEALLRERQSNHKDVDPVRVGLMGFGVFLALCIIYGLFAMFTLGTTIYKTYKLQKALDDFKLTKTFLDFAHDATNFREIVEKMSKAMPERDVRRIIKPVAKYLYDIDEFADMQDLYTKLGLGKYKNTAPPGICASY